MPYAGNTYHTNTLEIGQEFQDFIVERMAKDMGISISLYQSKKYQFDKGESLQGVEIKYDARSTGDCTYKQCKASGNVAIEVAEKSKPSMPSFTPSGIYRRDNTWLYIVGNYQCAWVFSKKTLQLMHASGIYNIAQTLPTLQTMLLPIADADKYCSKKLVFVN